MRRACSPCLVDEQGGPAPLRHVDFKDTSVAESFLQETLDRSPQVLPVDEFDSSYGPLISLGREIANIDNLFISPAGRLTVVETKLWRNPEATRKVVAQILDYAAMLSTWDYPKLESKAREALAPAPIGNRSLYEFVASQAPDEVVPEKDFVDEVQRGLSTGRFLLLIVGDGIRENIEAMLDVLQGHADKRFRFGLVQLQLFTTDRLPGQHLVVPQVIANSKEVVRAVVFVDKTGEVNINVKVDEQVEPRKPGSRPPTLDEEEFFAKIQDARTGAVFRDLLSFVSEVGAEAQWRITGASVRLRDPLGSKTFYTLFVMTTEGTVYFGWLPQQLRKVGMPEEIAGDYARKLVAAFPTLSLREGGLETAGVIEAAELAEKWDGFTQIVGDLVERLGSSD